MVLDAQLSWKENSQHCIQWCISIPKMPFRLEKMPSLFTPILQCTCNTYHYNDQLVHCLTGDVGFHLLVKIKGAGHKGCPHQVEESKHWVQHHVLQPYKHPVWHHVFATIQTPSMAPCFCNHTNTQYGTMFLQPYKHPVWHHVFATIQTPSMAPCFCNHTNTWYSTVPCPATIQTPSTAPCPVTIQTSSIAPCPVTIQTPSTAPCPVTIQTSSIVPCPATIQTPSTAPCPVTIQTSSIVPCPVTIQTSSIAKQQLKTTHTQIHFLFWVICVCVCGF